MDGDPIAYSYENQENFDNSAVLLSRFARKHGDTELSAAAKPLLASVLKYATDLAPNDPRTAQLGTLWLEVDSK